MLHRIIYIVILGGALIGLTLQIPESSSLPNPHQAEAKALFEKVPYSKYRNRLEHLVRLIDRIEEIEARNTLFFEVCRMTRYFLDIPGFHTRSFLERQTTLLTQATRSALYLEKTFQNKMDGKRVFSVGPYGYIKERPLPLHEVICSDLSVLFDCMDYIAPTCETFFNGKPMVYQPRIEAKVHNHLFQFSKRFSSRSKQIDLLVFWKFNLFMILLGHSDLVPFNIPITKRKIPVSWDNEYTFLTNLHVKAEKKRPQFLYQLPFVNVLLDYPQAYHKLSKGELSRVKRIMQKWKALQNNITLYMEHPYTKHRLTSLQSHVLQDRLTLLTDEALLKDDPILRNYIKHQFPDIFCGTEEACLLVEKILHEPVTPMSATYFIYGCRNWPAFMKGEDQEVFNKWIEKNHLKH